ncbi:hypothetical protein B7463_g7074, partial [Scytalidium lignicola]
MESTISSPSAQSGAREIDSIWQIQAQTASPQAGQQRRHRTSTQRVRTGCITCKRRHIKCDEEKPQCSNCLKSRGHCEGYPVGGKKKKPPGPAQVVWDSMQVVRVPQSRMPLPLDPDSLDFRDDEGMRYFGEFVDLVHAPWTTATSNGDLWAVTMPQLTHGNQTLRYAAMAIGALSKWHSTQTKSNSLRAVSVPNLPSVEGDTHYFHAVAYYCRSLKLQNQQGSLLDAVFLSVLLLFFEALRGNRKAALDHVNHGLTLLLTLTTDQDAHDHIFKFAPNPEPVISSVADVFTYLAPQARAVLRGRFGQSPPPLPNLMKRLKDKKQTMESFMVLLSQLPRSSPTLDRIPVVFSSLSELEEFWIPFQRKQTAIGLIMQEIIQASKTSESKNKDADSFYLDLLGSSRIREFCEDSMKVVEALNTAFSPLFNKIMMSDTESLIYLRAIHLRLQLLGMYIFEDPPAFLDMEMLQSRTPLFREYLSLADIALRTTKQQTKNAAHQLSLQCSLALYLLSVALHCRDPLVRDQAVWMLKDYPGEDGLWNTRSLYAIALRNRTVEQANAAEGTPAEQLQRLWRREFIFEDGGDRVVFRYISKDETSQTWQLVEEAADVHGEAENMDWKRQPLSGSGGPLIRDIYSI